MFRRCGDLMKGREGNASGKVHAQLDLSSESAARPSPVFHVSEMFALVSVSAAANGKCHERRSSPASRRHRRRAPLGDRCRRPGSSSANGFDGLQISRPEAPLVASARTAARRQGCTVANRRRVCVEWPAPVYCLAPDFAIRILARGGSPMKQSVTFRFDPRLLAEAKRVAGAENRTLTNFVETLLLKRVGARLDRQVGSAGSYEGGADPRSAAQRRNKAIARDINE